MGNLIYGNETFKGITCIISTKYWLWRVVLLWVMAGRIIWRKKRGKERKKQPYAPHSVCWRIQFGADADQKKHISSSKHDPHITSSVGVRGWHFNYTSDSSGFTNSNNAGRGRCWKPCSVAQGPRQVSWLPSLCTGDGGKGEERGWKKKPQTRKGGTTFITCEDWFRSHERKGLLMLVLSNGEEKESDVKHCNGV